MKNPSRNVLWLGPKILARGTGPNDQRSPCKSAASKNISANFLLFDLSRSHLGNTQVDKTNMHGTETSTQRDLSTAGAAHGEDERRSWAKHRVSRAAYEPGVWCLWALPPGMECQDGCPVNFSKHFSALFSALFWSDRRASGVRAGCPRDGGLGWLCPNFLSTFFCTFFCTFLGGTPAGWRAGIKMGDQTQSASHLWTRTCQVLSSSDK